MGQNRYSLSDSDMLGIQEEIEKANYADEITFFGIKATWNAILAQEGKSWDDFTPENPLPTTEFSIPRDQSAEIAERMKKHAAKIGISPLGQTNILMDYMNYGPLYYES